MIKLENPPNYEQIVAAFPEASKPGVLFAYGECVYNPSGVFIPRALLQHEYRHCARQFQGREVQWWADYIADSDFRYHEELLGHVDELKVLISDIRDRNTRHKILLRTAIRLTAPLYNYQPPRTQKQAMRDLLSYF